MSSIHPSLSATYSEGHRPDGGAIHRLVALTDGELVELAALTMSRLRTHGLVVNPASRLAKSMQRIEQAKRWSIQLGGGDPATEEWLAEAKRTVMEIATIVAVLGGRMPEIKHMVKRTISGPVDPVDGRNDRARDTQAELLVAAALTAGGIDVQYREPDIVAVELLGRRTGVAVKRVTSKNPAQLHGHLRKARNQLVSAGVAGLIVVNAERRLHRLYRQHPAADLSAALYEDVSRWLDYIVEQDKEGAIDGVVGVATSLTRAGQSFDTRLHFKAKVVVRSTDDGEALMLGVKSLTDAMATGLFHAVRRGQNLNSGM